ncbi:MAG TPA: hypothetical protein DCR14_20195, partial [Acidimicrobiaceae bacterium]|nr:hypothetical protein [Acidimicrobiaceae bacterium]
AVHLTVRWTLRRATAWAPTGHLVAIDQVALRSAARGSRPPERGSDAAIDDLLVEPVQPWLFRAPVDNDGFKLMPELAERIRVGGMALLRWQQQGIDTAAPA